jgi:hypothetical protein
MTDRASKPGPTLQFVNQGYVVVRRRDSFIVQTAIDFSGVYHTVKMSVN